MAFDPNIHHRRSIRLQGYDYSKSGAYFVTICTQNRACLFGDIIDGNIQLNNAGKMVNNWWNQLTHKYKNIELDKFIVMPNHLHGLIIVGAGPRVCPDDKKGEHIGSHDNPLGEYVGENMGEHAVQNQTCLANTRNHNKTNRANT